ncbi:MAG: type II toxin-antitoxin system RelE/ParE family toxin [Lachnospiraceae bacterium oral taxon 082]|jgi:addiction module toxin, relE/stbE family|uniref:type II toxin-antitoxin system RelE family toxin n=1 Tax=Lachnoanaerobaculum orale TaxID=979627 RepID=UPI000247148B|nr:type II toxin-antitoxin system RelE/ParE family toxin [Lachnoanaerobaculum orale]EHO52888.1 addiction module toxin, RelE/StbE family [Lachnospiraceae bacterium oral taxon 082 str. F0431]MBS6930419.1 type II toxin-antitoxin system RelE/ParE family toxin [Lachnospiraceae bacterium oral taxon 082]
MRYTVEYTSKALKSLKKLDKPVLLMIKSWIEKNLIGTTEPRRHGKGLTSNRSGQWRYRVGDYRIIADIEDEKLIILVVEVEHRSRVYK